MSSSAPTSSPLLETALITGASSGIGLHLAREFARHGHPLILVAPVQSELESVATEIRADFDVKVYVFAHDLRSASEIESLFEQLATIDILPAILVNNAGLGRWGRFWETPLEEDINMLRLNAEAPIRLTKRMLPLLLQRGGGRILNTASIAGFEPGPLLAVYHATKAFILSWSEALATELEETKVTVTTLCPGPVDTDFFPKAGMVDTHAFQDAKVMAPQDVASAAYTALMDGKRVVVPGAINKGLVFSRRLLPESAQASFNQKLYSSTDPAARKRERGQVERLDSGR